MKRHSLTEIAAKVKQADDLAARGQSQAQICKSLGVSVMTLHRWRKQHGQHDVHEEESGRHKSAAHVDITTSQSVGRETSTENSPLDELVLENRRLRRIVTDLLLEKARLEEAVNSALEPKAPGSKFVSK